jgi:hypothetical protein
MKLKHQSKGEVTLAVIAVIAVVCLVGGFFVHKKIADNTTPATKIINKEQNAVDKIDDKITKSDASLSAIKTKKLEDIAVLATGTDYSLKKITNPPQPVIVAQELNQRVISEAGYSPTIEELKKMQKMVDDLILSNKLGAIELQIKDREIAGLLKEEDKILKEKSIENEKLRDYAKDLAVKADNSQTELSQYKSYFGLGAVFIGLKTFIKNCVWFLVGTGVLWLILRLLSTVNPIFGAIYGIVDTMASMVIHIIGLIAPKALSMVQSVETSAVNKIVDSIQYVKENKGDIEALKTELGNTLTDKEKALIASIKKKYNW